MGPSANECAAVIYDTTSFQKARKENKEVKNVSPVAVAAPVARSLSPPRLVCVCLLCYAPRVFVLLWCEVPSWIPHSPQMTRGKSRPLTRRRLSTF